MLTVCTLLWQPNGKSRDFSRMYDETWVEKLYRGFQRNLTVPFRFVCYSDRAREYSEPIEQKVVPGLGRRGYSDCIKPFELGVPMLLCGLDTLVTGSCDKLAAWCFEEKVMCLPRDPYKPNQAINGVCLVPAGWERIAKEHRGQNDMEHVRRYPHRFIDDEFPGFVRSWKGHVRDHGLNGTKVIYFHGREKMHELAGNPIIETHWR